MLSFSRDNFCLLMLLLESLTLWGYLNYVLRIEFCVFCFFFLIWLLKCLQVGLQCMQELFFTSGSLEYNLLGTRLKEWATFTLVLTSSEPCDLSLIPLALEQCQK